MQMRGVFVTGTSTDVGKTHVASTLIRALRQKRSCRVRGCKPIETGGRRDAQALAVASDDLTLVDWPGLYRSEHPLAPLAVELMGFDALELGRVVDATRGAVGADFGVVEGAGGFMVPLSARYTNADLCCALGLPVIVVALDQLGVLSDVLTTCFCIESHGLPVHAVVLNAVQPDHSSATNLKVLEQHLNCGVFGYPKLNQGFDTSACEMLGPLIRTLPGL